MTLGASDIDMLCREVQALGRGAQVQRVQDGRPGEVVLRMRAPGRTLRLLIAAGSVDARIHLVFRKALRRWTRDRAPTPFVQLLRKHLSGSRLDRAEQVRGDRIARVAFARRDQDDAGEPVDRRLSLLAELTGRHGNLFLLDEAGIILGSLRANVSHRRKLIPGEPWTPPALPPSASPPEPSRLPDDQTGHASRAVDRLYEQRLERERLETTRSRVAGALRRAARRAERRLTNIERDLHRAERADRFVRWGELLQSAYGKVKRGATEVEVPDYYDPDLAPTTIPLDPALSLAENVQRYFKEGKRLTAARDRIEARLRQARAEIDRLREAEQRVLDQTAPEAIDAIADELRADKLLRRRQMPAQKAPANRAYALPYREFRSSSGLPILVGKGARDNDRLTFRVARGRDLWLHVDGAAGAHVVVPLDKGKTADGQTLVEAAMLAAHYSDRRHDTRVDVRYTSQKNVKKPKGAPPGRVLVSTAKTIHIRLDPDALKALFDRTTE